MRRGKWQRELWICQNVEGGHRHKILSTNVGKHMWRSIQYINISCIFTLTTRLCKYKPGPHAHWEQKGPHVAKSFSIDPTYKRSLLDIESEISSFFPKCWWWWHRPIKHFPPPFFAGSRTTVLPAMVSFISLRLNPSGCVMAATI